MAKTEKPTPFDEVVFAETKVPKSVQLKDAPVSPALKLEVSKKATAKQVVELIKDLGLDVYLTQNRPAGFDGIYMHIQRVLSSNPKLTDIHYRAVFHAFVTLAPMMRTDKAGPVIKLDGRGVRLMSPLANATQLKFEDTEVKSIASDGPDGKKNEGVENDSSAGSGDQTDDTDASITADDPLNDEKKPEAKKKGGRKKKEDQDSDK